MPIVIERSAQVIARDEESGWAMSGGRIADGSVTKEMTHSSGARCTLLLESPDYSQRSGTTVRVRGMLYLKPGEDPNGWVMKVPDEGDFVSAHDLYEIAARLTSAW